ncbi:hypothetical protein EJ08DRAFT_409369 [Tothia fuscella]|uniref:Uncharacterized protein n=1 Tax=Tothia fuscella TaxID=1048955 RepID=A0A9P4TVM9_9PEZI|nr:hypothetical protein EJ08DRAFT_409369 [Tothia fuscella]
MDSIRDSLQDALRRVFDIFGIFLQTPGQPVVKTDKQSCKVVSPPTTPRRGPAMSVPLCEEIDKLQRRIRQIGTIIANIRSSQAHGPPTSRVEENIRKHETLVQSLRSELMKYIKTSDIIRRMSYHELSHIIANSPKNLEAFESDRTNETLHINDDSLGQVYSILHKTKNKELTSLKVPRLHGCSERSKHLQPSEAEAEKTFQTFISLIQPLPATHGVQRELLATAQDHEQKVKRRRANIEKSAEWGRNDELARIDMLEDRGPEFVVSATVLHRWHLQGTMNMRARLAEAEIALREAVGNHIGFRWHKPASERRLSHQVLIGHMW